MTLGYIPQSGRARGQVLRPSSLVMHFNKITILLKRLLNFLQNVCSISLKECFFANKTHEALILFVTLNQKIDHSNFYETCLYLSFFCTYFLDFVLPGTIYCPCYRQVVRRCLRCRKYARLHLPPQDFGSFKNKCSNRSIDV